MSYVIAWFTTALGVNGLAVFPMPAGATCSQAVAVAKEHLPPGALVMCGGRAHIHVAVDLAECRAVVSVTRESEVFACAIGPP